jgi:hypothetical protein
MSALGHKQTCAAQQPTSALPLKADMLRQNVPSLARVAAGDRGFFTLIHVRDFPDL